jgi:hypothetical protein
VSQYDFQKGHDPVIEATIAGSTARVASPIYINVPAGLTYVVNLTGGTLYTDSTLGTPVSFPQTITVTTGYWANGPGTFTLSCKFQGTELAGYQVASTGRAGGVTYYPSTSVPVLSVVETAQSGAYVAATPAPAAWQATHSYTVGQTFTNSGTTYIVATAYTSGSSFGSTDTTNTWTVGGGAANGTGFSAYVGNNSALTYTVTHNMGTKSVATTVIDQTSGQQVFPTVTVTTTNAITVTFASAPTSNQMLVLVQPVVTGTPSGGVSITSPGATIAVGGTSLAPTLDVVGGGGGGAALLAVHAYTPGSTATGYTTSSATFSDVDATNLALTFTTKATGLGSAQVLIRMSAYGRCDSTNQAALWGIDDSVAGQIVASQINMTGDGNNLRLNYEFLYTGLSPNTTYTVKWAFAVGGGSVARIFVGGSGTNNPGAALMTAWAA